MPIPSPRPRARSVAHAVVAIGLVLSLLVPRLALAASPHGAESPQALVARLNAAAAKNDFAELAACVAPDERAVMALMMAVMGGVMIAFMGMGGEIATGLAEGMAEGISGQEADAAQKAEMAKAKAEMDQKGAALQKRYEAILTKHGLDKRLEEVGKAEGMSMAAEGGPDPAKARELLEGIDDVALLRDLMALFQELGDDSGKQQSPIHVPKDLTEVCRRRCEAFLLCRDPNNVVR